jgi:hypothetical protein
MRALLFAFSCILAVPCLHALRRGLYGWAAAWLIAGVGLFATTWMTV